MSELVTDYMEHAVPFRTRLDMWLHLLRCDACRRYFDQVRHTVRLLGNRPPTPPDRDTIESMLTITRGYRQPDP